MDSVVKILRGLGRRILGTLGAAIMTLAFFLVLPLMQAIGGGPKHDMDIATFDTANLPPPPPPPVEEEPEEEEQEEEQAPELTEEAQPLDLSQLELALNPGFSESWMGADFSVQLNAVGGKKGGGLEELFSLSDLDQRPRATYQPSPALSAKIRKRAPGTVYILFIVDERGRVVKPKVQKSTDPIFERSALNAVKQWKFEPGMRNGQPVRFRMRVPISFPKA